MFPLVGLLAAGILAGLGYLCLWAGARTEARGMKLFGKVLGIVLLCVAGLALAAHLICLPGRMMAGCGPGQALGPCGGAGPCGGPGQMRIEKHVCRMGDDDDEVDEMMGDLLPDMFEDFIAESPEFEARVQQIVKEMQTQPR